MRFSVVVPVYRVERYLEHCLTSARKAGSSVAEGEYIVSIDGDDFVDKILLDGGRHGFYRR